MKIPSDPFLERRFPASSSDLASFLKMKLLAAMYISNRTPFIEKLFDRDLESILTKEWRALLAYSHRDFERTSFLFQ